jgi:adenine-specific DNA glycosylase
MSPKANAQELGATICKPQNPNCESCPVSGDCLAYAELKLVSAGKALEYDIEDSDGYHKYNAHRRDLWPLSVV